MKPRNHSFLAVHAFTLILILGGGYAHGGNTWDGGGVDDFWSTSANWDPDGAPAYGTLTFIGSTQTTNTVDANANQSLLLWQGTSAWTLNSSGGAVISLFDNGGSPAKIENQSTGLVTINAPIRFAATAGSAWGEINAVNGNLTFGSAGTIEVSGSAVNELRFYGSGRTVTIDSIITAGSRKLVIAPTASDNNTVILNAANSFSGNTEVNAGVLRLGNSGALGSGITYLGNGGAAFASINASLLLDSSGLTVSNSLVANKADTGAGLGTGVRTIGGTFTSGSSTFSGNLFLNGRATLAAGTGGAVRFSGAIQNGTDAGNVDRGINISAAGGTVVLAGDNTFTGVTNINAGTLVLDKTSGAQLYKTGAFFGNNNTIYLNANTGGTFQTYNWDYGSNGALSELRNNYYAVNLNGGTIRMDDTFSSLRGFQVGASGGTLEVTAGNTYTKNAGTTANQNVLRFTANSTLTITGAGNTVIGDSLAPASYGNTGFGITKTGTGNLTLSGFSRYTGNTTLSGGTTKITGGIYQGAYQSGAVLTLNGGATIELNSWSYDQTGSTQSLGGLRANNDAIVINNGTIRMVGTTATSYGRGLTVQSGGATFEAAVGANWTLAFDVANSYTGNPSITLAGAGSGTFDKVINSGSGGLTKSGGGTWSLSRANTYTGNTTISGGTLALGSTGSIAQSSQIILGANTTLDVSAVSNWTVGSSQTLSGVGTVQGNVLVAGDLRPGTSPGALTIAGNLGLNVGSDWFVEIGGTNPADFDRLFVSGQLAAAGTIWVSFVNGFNASVSNNFDIANFSSFTDNGYAFNFTNAVLGSGLTWDTTSFASDGIITVVPEPSALLLMGLGFTGLVFRRERRSGTCG